jgi:hypothetical protein
MFALQFFVFGIDVDLLYLFSTELLNDNFSSCDNIVSDG